MKAKIYCRPVAKDVHEFYLMADGEKYYLFEQRFYLSTHAYFKKGVQVEDVGDFRKASTLVVRNTLEKLPKYLKKLKKRYALSFCEKKRAKIQKKEKYKNQWLFDCEQAA